MMHFSWSLSSGITYENECELKVASCRLQTEITIKFNGSCGTITWNYSTINTFPDHFFT
jgi:hypothetical protein